MASQDNNNSASPYYTDPEGAKLGMVADVLHGIDGLARIVTDYATPDPFRCTVDNFSRNGEHHDPGSLWKPLGVLEAVPRRVEVRCNWKDQGWGNKKGRVHLRAYRGEELVLNECLFGICGHEWAEVNREIAASELSHLLPRDRCELWIIIGGGGGHRLQIQGFSFEMHFL